ncbi:MAG: MATE family efflux transporter, partial [Clostridia bacterium]|nr:MATE family efflux transporter [Clostridia bacterium]
ECLWSWAMTLRNQCYSVRGLDAVAAQNIGSTLVNVFSVVYLALGTSVSIIVGNLLGAGKIREAKEADRKILSFAAVCGLMMGVLMSGVSTFFPMLYNTSEDVRNLASFMILVSACMMPAHAFSHGTYFTLRSGGQVLITFLLDGIFMWVVIMPLSFVLSRFTLLPIRPLYIICQGAEILKVFLGLFLLKRDTWAKQLVADNTLKQ